MSVCNSIKSDHQIFHTGSKWWMDLTLKAKKVLAYLNMNTFPVKPQRGPAGQLFLPILAETQQRRDLVVITGEQRTGWSCILLEFMLLRISFIFSNPENSLIIRNKPNMGMHVYVNVCVRVCQLRVLHFFFFGTARIIVWSFIRDH